MSTWEDRQKPKVGVRSLDLFAAFEAAGTGEGRRWCVGGGGRQRDGDSEESEGQSKCE